MAKVIGIDLGTTNSVAGLKTLETEIVPNTEGDLLTPSVVGYQKSSESDPFIVGQPALDWMTQDPENTIVAIKRLMGRNFSDEEVQRFVQEQHYAYSIKSLAMGSVHSVAVLLHEQEYTPEQISAKILEKIKHDCEQRLGESVEYAVVTVPAYFNDKQKHATRIAAALAGLKVQRLLPEPTAAAISFGVDSMAVGEAQTILVFDLGGGTFDLSVLTIADGQFIEQGKGGDMWMGGDDIDALIRRYVYQQTEQENEVEDLPALIENLPTIDKNRFLGDLKRKVEAAKIRLSSHERAVIEILGLLKDEDGDILDVEVELSRNHFEELLMPFVERSIALTQKVVEDIHFELDLIDKVVMVGGSSCIPLVIEKMKALFGEDKVLVHERPMLAIAEGAAILAHRLADNYECPACGHQVSQSDDACSACGFDLKTNLAKTGVVDIVHTISHDYFLELEDGSGHLLAQKNTPLPYQTQETFQLMDAKQRLAHFKFYNTVNEVKESIGDLWLSFEFPLQDNDQKAPEVLLDFEIDSSNLINVSANLLDQPEIRVSRTLSRGKRDEKLFLDLEQSITEVNETPPRFYAAYDFLHRSVTIADIINRIIDPETGQEDTAASQEAARLQAVANEMVALGESALGKIYYGQYFIADFRHLLKEDELKRLEDNLQALQDRYDHGSVEQILEASDEFSEELDEHPLLLSLKDLQRASNITAQTDPARTPRYQKYIWDIENAIRKGDHHTLRRLFNEINPEVDAIISTESSRNLHIWKEIRKS